ncbi:YbgA family protein [Methanolobus profundi]|uniref:Uncharacterized conserved protein YbgA, DUF1722 family n=1 Tax=Methanolobus profundi TaxID=487685 RepID=A0A1I4NLZ0_9EURY|nr:DUF523 and DUF1722 domain-containing protein [Methanolobus profundi]SFM16544.1 Uncharacterized conserved protein YbgA, DUF1722 family [Methanolobus profundi]
MGSHVNIVHSRPIIVISKCLGFANCRYDGQITSFPLMETMRPFVEFIDVCPECEIGLGVPREPILIVDDGSKRLIQPATGLDLTEKMNGFSRSYLERLDDFDGFILRSRSPSCGIGTTKVFPDKYSDEYLHREGNGLFAETVLSEYPDLPAIDEEKMADPFLRDHFLTRVFALASFRDASLSGKIHTLVEYHTRNKLLFMAYDKTLLSEMGDLAANRGNIPVEKVYERYLSLLLQMLSKPVGTGPVVNALMHAFGYFSRHMSAGEKFIFMQRLQKYREGNISIFELKEWFISKAEEFKVDYLLEQTFFCPYPAELSGSLEIV